MEQLTPEDKSRFDSYKSKISKLMGKIKAIVDQGRKIEKDDSQLFMFKGMYRELKPYFESFNDTWDKLIELALDKPDLFPTKNDLAFSQAVEHYYYEGCAIYEKYMNPTPVAPVSLQSQPSKTDTAILNESRTVRARLPQINLPQFGGNPTEWPMFRDTYKSLIHNEATLSDMEKFLFLVSCLHGPARSLISNVSLVEDNYEQAWDLLLEHYDDKRKLAHTYLKQVLEFKPLMGKPTSNSLKTIITCVLESIDSFKNLGIRDSGDLILSYLVLRCLDHTTKTSFEKRYADVDFPTYQNLVDFIKSEWKSLDAHCIESDQSSSGKIFPSYRNPVATRHPKNSLFSGNGSQNFENTAKQFQKRENPTWKRNDPKFSCPVCKAMHSLYKCNRFKGASAANKLALLKDWTGCINCLSAKHSTHACTSLRRCSTCNQCHHTWLHQVQVQAAQPAVPGHVPAQQVNQGENGVTLGSTSGRGEVLLGTAIVRARDSGHQYQDIRIVIDSGSQFSFMTAECARKLDLTIEPCNQKIVGIGQVDLPTTLGRLTCNIRSTITSFADRELTTRVIVVPKITTILPQTAISDQVQALYNGYALADPKFWKPSQVDFLLGGDLFFDILTGEPIIVNPDVPRLIPTIFGFVIAGPMTLASNLLEGTCFFIQTPNELKDIMDKFWEIEEVKPVRKMSEEDEYCLKHYEETHYRLDSGRYVVSLPSRPSIQSLQSTRSQAMRRLMNLEAKLDKDSRLKQEYHTFMKDYLELGHMQLASPSAAIYTIPHHAVVKTQDGQLKLRVVFDASCKSSSGSLNDHLYVGPKLQLDIVDILTNFRTYKIVLTADIIKMYRQIQVHPPDRAYQHILWRFDPAEAIQNYELCTVTQGEASASFQAENTILQLVKDEGAPFPLASRALMEDTYVDDVVTGATSLEEAMKLQEELIQLLSKGCFELSKWASNHKNVLSSLDTAQCQLSPISLSLISEPKIKLLGMQWIPNQDIFTYEISNPSWHPSKRAILSSIARIFDPLGFLSPVVFYAKTIMQDMWISKCNWDDMGPPEICRKWHKFLSQLSSLSQIKLPRSLTQGDSKSYSIIGFSDASQRGYSAVLYLIPQEETDFHPRIIKAKSKLAPIKPMTIPRLELSGALLLSRLFKSCGRLCSKLTISEVKLFTDSEIVLGWISTPPQRLNAFVAHRIVQILELTDKSQWNHVKSEDNPADCSSRGLLPAEFVNYSLWWAGPHWMKLPQEEWPNKQIEQVNLPETKGSQVTSLAIVQTEIPFIIKWIERFSKFSRLIHSVSYILRFISLCKGQPFESGPVTICELRKATKILIRINQSFYKIDKRHLCTLSPYQDEDSILRVGGRLENSSLQQDQKHPVIISGKCHFAKLLVDHYHKSYIHLGPSALQAVLQSKYWIVSARRLIRRCVFNCITCYKSNRTPQPPLMGNLPTFRLEDGQVFKHVGVDFGGPFVIRESSRRKSVLGKCYLCLFICMTTKAVHLEVVSRCSTEAFLACLDRFIARRGKPSYVYSDCGTNFVGAANKLRDILLWLRSSQTQDNLIRYVTQQEIQWSFNPPSSPHFGGIWEAGIKSAKTILSKIIGQTPLTYEELATLFCKIEGILNSRPLTPLTSDPTALDCLTPGHFLIGRPLIAAPEQDLTEEHVSPLKRWEMLQQRSQHFWVRWKREYLHTLQQRRKWTSTTNDIKKGDLVIVKDMKSPQRFWPLARVTDTHPGADGITRVVTIKTSSGSYKRPVIKLVPLTPINNTL